MITTVIRIASTAVALPLVTGLALLQGGIASAQGSQYPMLDKVSENVIQKYRTTPCQELAQRRQNPPQSAIEKRAVEMLAADPKLRAEFFSRVGGAVLDKLFTCGLIP